MSALLLHPSRSVEEKWRGALTRRLKRRPLEAFLRAHALTFAPPGPIDDRRNLKSATEFMLGSACAAYRQSVSFVDEHVAILTQIACAAATGVGRLIEEPGAARVGGLSAAVQLLAAEDNYVLAARIGAAYRDFYAATLYSPALSDVADLAGRTVAQDDVGSWCALSEALVMSLKHYRVACMASLDEALCPPSLAATPR
jgi:hypothetical protein